jgi:hypothetical protein
VSDFFADLQEAALIVIGPALPYLYAALLGGAIILSLVVVGIGALRRYNK